MAPLPAPGPPAPDLPDPLAESESKTDRPLVLRQAGATGGINRSYLPGPTSHKRRRYMSVQAKFLSATAFSAVWVSFSVWLAIPWILDTASVVSLVPAIIIVTLLAFVPGGLVAFLLASILLDHQPRLTDEHPSVGVTVVIAARNESAAIGETIKYMAAQDYDGTLHVILVDNGSTDDTAIAASRVATEQGLSLR